MKLDPCFIPYTKIKVKWVKDLNIRPQTMKLPGREHKEKLLDIVLGNYFLDITPKPKATKTKVGKKVDIKCKSKGNN